MVDTIYVGVDIGKEGHYAGLISTPLLDHHKVYTRCPTFHFDNTREGFEKLLRNIKIHVSRLKNAHVLMERTGHYGAPLEQYLQEHGITLYRMQAGKRLSQEKSDRRDAQALGLKLYNQIERGAQVSDEKEKVHRIVPPSPAACTLHGLIKPHATLTKESVQRENQLTAINDELFPEFRQIFKKVNTLAALAIREKFPTPQDITRATLDELCAARHYHYPSRDQLAHLQELAKSTIGTRDINRRRSLLVRQRQLIAEWRLTQLHIQQLETEITDILQSSREGQILLSFIGVGAITAAVLLATIGNIENFSTVGKLRLMLGWGIRHSQTGTTFDSSKRDRAGNKQARYIIYMAVMSMIDHDPAWKALYDSKVPDRCFYDASRGEYVGKSRVIGRIAGQFIGLVYRLLKKDHDLLASLPTGSDPPAPELYSVEKHLRAIGHARVRHAIAPKAVVL
jgi:transposase